MIKNFTAVDIETTGLSAAKEKIIEIGAVKYRNGKEKEVFSSLINPCFNLPERIIELTGITDDMLLDAPYEKQVIEEFLDFAGNDVILGHNIIFDYSFLKTAAVRNGRDFNVKAIDTLYIAKVVHKELESRTLADMCKFYKVVNEHAHRAYDDAKAAADIYFNMLERFYNKNSEIFEPKELFYTLKKDQPATQKQINYLMALISQKGIDITLNYASLTKSETSRLIDKLKSQKTF